MRSHMLRLYESFAVVAPLPACLQVTNLASIPVAAYFGCSLSVYIVKVRESQLRYRGLLDRLLRR